MSLKYSIFALLAVSFGLSGCLSSSGDSTPGIDSPILFEGMQFGLADTVTTRRILEISGTLYVTNGRDVRMSQNQGQSWQALPALPVLPHYLFEVGGILHVASGPQDSVYRLQGNGWAGTSNGGLPEEGTPYAVSAGGKDYVCGLSWEYFSYGECGEVVYVHDTLEFRSIAPSSSYSSLVFAHFVSGDSLYLLRNGPSGYDVLYVPPGTRDPEAMVELSQYGLEDETPGGTEDTIGGKRAADPIKIRPPSQSTRLQSRPERFALLQGALYIGTSSRLHRIKDGGQTVVDSLRYSDEGINDNGYGVFEAIGRQLFYTGAGAKLFYLNGNSLARDSVPHFEDKRVLDVAASGGNLVVATYGGIYWAKIKR